MNSENQQAKASERLPQAEEAQELIKAIEDVEREEAGDSDAED